MCSSSASQTPDPGFSEGSLAWWPQVLRSLPPVSRLLLRDPSQSGCKRLGWASVNWFRRLPDDCLFPPFSGRFRSHSTSQSPGMQGAAAHPHPVLVHGCPRALHHSVSGLLQEHPRHHPGQEWTGAGGRSLDPEDSLSVHPRGIQFDPTPVNRHISVTGACSGVSYPKVRFSVMSTGINSWRADELWRWKGDLRGHSPAFLSPYEKTESQ